MGLGYVRRCYYKRTRVVTGRYSTVNPEIFARILFSRIASKDIITTLIFARLGHDLSRSVNDRVISTFARILFSRKIALYAKVSRK